MFKSPNDATDTVYFLRNRAQVERQVGTNQMAAGQGEGRWRLNRANALDACADELINLRLEITVLSETIKSKDEDISKLKSK